MGIHKKGIYYKYLHEATRIHIENPGMKGVKIARQLLSLEGKDGNLSMVTQLARYLKRNVIGKKHDIAKGDSDREKLSAMKSDGSIMSPEEFCEFYGLNQDHYNEAKLINHLGTPTYNMKFKSPANKAGSNDKDEVLALITESLNNFNERKDPHEHIKGDGDYNNSAVHCIADIHLGMVVKGDDSIRLDSYSPDVAMRKLSDSAAAINRQNNLTNTVVINGDILEAVQLMHISQYREIDADYTGAKGIILAAQILNDCFLSKIDRLEKVYFPSSNHGRLGGMNKADGQRGDAELLVSHILKLHGYNTEYNAVIGKFKVDGISYLYTHGQLGLIKKSADHLINNFGYKDEDFTCILSAHTHDPKSKESNLIQESQGGYLHLICPPIVTGGEFSVDLGYSSGDSGFLTMRRSINGKVDFTKTSL